MTAAAPYAADNRAALSSAQVPGQRGPAPAGSAGLELVVVRLGGGRYALAMDSIAEVGRPPALTRVPGLPAWVTGVANWRGRVLPVLDLRPLLGAGGTDLDRRARLVIVAHRHPALGEVRLGLLVEAVAGSAVTPQEMEPPLASLPSSVCGLLRGQVTDVDGPYGVLDLDAIVALADTLPRARRTA